MIIWIGSLPSSTRVGKEGIYPMSIDTHVKILSMAELAA